MGCQCINSSDEKNSEVLKQSTNNGEGNEKEQDDNIKDSNIFGLNQKKNSKINYNEGGLDKYDNNDNNGINEVNAINEINEMNEINETNDRNMNEQQSSYSETIVKLINQIRQDPVSYADTIEESICNIVEEVAKNKIIYKKKVKVALNKGEPAFKEAAEILRQMSPLPPLIFKPEICIPLPDIDEDIKDPSYLKEQVKIIRENYNIDVFFKDLIKIPEVSALLMIVDDSGKNPGRKRQAVLNPNFKYIGVTSRFIGKTFVAYFSFSK